MVLAGIIHGTVLDAMLRSGSAAWLCGKALPFRKAPLFFLSMHPARLSLAECAPVL